MDKKLKYLLKYEINATDGEIGKVEDFYFDEHLWTIRYIVVNTGNWLLKNLVLLSPVCVDKIDDASKRIEINLTKEQVENSPDIDTAKPISRQRELELSRYYKIGYYWAGYNIWGAAPLPVYLRNLEPSEPEHEAETESIHLRSMNEIQGYHVQTETEEWGHVEDIVINQENWAIDYFVLNTSAILPGKNIEVNIRWIKDISWEEKKVYIKLSKKIIQAALR